MYIQRVSKEVLPVDMRLDIQKVTFDLFHFIDPG